MTYAETLDYLYTRLPMFNRLGAAALKKDLVNTIAFCDWLDNPQHKFRSVHVAGTNGKGSTSHMLAAAFQAAGYKTGLYTSPHLKDFRERIRINGKMIAKTDVRNFVEKCKPLIEAIEPSFFEATVGLAFEHFARNKVDIAIIEVGLGGRLDSTNVITPLLSVITNISRDHMSILGDTLPEIAAEKAGIIKPGIPVVIGEKQGEVAEVFIRKADAERAPLVFATDADQTAWGTVRSDLTGAYQSVNIRTVLAALDALHTQGFNLPRAVVKEALRHVGDLTGLAGRWQTLSTHPLVICDTGHNEAGIQEVLKSIHTTPHRNLHLVIGMMKDKEHAKVLAMLPKKARYYFCRPKLERALPAESLKREAADFGLQGTAYTTVRRALAAAKKRARTDDLIVVGGSTFVVAEVL